MLSKLVETAADGDNAGHESEIATKMVLHNPNNWHWVNKDVSGWAREYLDKELAGISAEDDGLTVKLDKVISMDGDVDVSQRKGKVITLFDVQLKLEYSGMSFSLCHLLVSGC